MGQDLARVGPQKVKSGECGSKGMAWVEVLCPSHPPGPPQVIEYKSARDLETFSKFLDNGGKLPKEEPTKESLAPFPVSASVLRFQASGQVLLTGGHRTRQQQAKSPVSIWASVTLSRRHQPIPPRSPKKSYSCPHVSAGEPLFPVPGKLWVLNKELWSWTVCGS